MINQTTTRQDESGNTYDLHSTDALENLSYFVGRCRGCGEEIRHTIMREKPVAYMLCDCGMVLKAENRTRWH